MLSRKWKWNSREIHHSCGAMAFEKWLSENLVTDRWAERKHFSCFKTRAASRMAGAENGCCLLYWFYFSFITSHPTTGSHPPPTCRLAVEVHCLASKQASKQAHAEEMSSSNEKTQKKEKEKCHISARQAQLLNPLKTTINFHFNGTVRVRLGWVSGR